MFIYWPGNISLFSIRMLWVWRRKGSILLLRTALTLIWWILRDWGMEGDRSSDGKRVLTGWGLIVAMGEQHPETIHFASPRDWPCYLICDRSGKLWARVGKHVNDYTASQWPSCNWPSTLHCHWLQSEGAGRSHRKDGEGDQRLKIPVSKNHGTLKSPILLNIKCGWKGKHEALLSQKKKKKVMLKNMKAQKNKTKLN